MSKNVYDVLKERGYIAQVTDEIKVRELLANEAVTFYTGYDPTADSLHVGHFLQLMVMAHLQKAGHRPIVILGGGTGMIGDPSGRTDLRQVLTPEKIQYYIERFKTQMSILLDFSADKALMLDNGKWILPLNYIDFMREIGSQFSVNRMLTAECYKARLLTGLTFLEFNYMLLQAYDYLVLNREYNCKLQFGGDDQWSNILAGCDLIRRKEQKEVYGMTFTLLTTADGQKMGKTAKGALWLEEDKCSVFDFYQYWRNVDDSCVCKYMKLLTFMDLTEIAPYENLNGAALNEAKARLALEVTAIVHGRAKAELAAQQALDIFTGQGRPEDMPGCDFSSNLVGKNLLDILLECKFIPSKAEGRRLIQQKGLALNDVVLSDPFYCLTPEDICSGAAIVRKGKKNYFALRQRA